jgi:hypothetical protein
MPQAVGGDTSEQFNINSAYGDASTYTNSMKIRTIVASNKFASAPNIQLESRVLLPPTKTQAVHNTFAVSGVKLKVRGRS